MFFVFLKLCLPLFQVSAVDNARHLSCSFDALISLDSVAASYKTLDHISYVCIRVIEFSSSLSCFILILILVAMFAYTASFLKSNPYTFQIYFISGGKCKRDS